MAFRDSYAQLTAENLISPSVFAKYKPSTHHPFLVFFSFSSTLPQLSSFSFSTFFFFFFLSFPAVQSPLSCSSLPAFSMLSVHGRRSRSLQILLVPTLHLLLRLLWPSCLVLLLFFLLSFFLFPDSFLECSITKTGGSYLFRDSSTV